jgi:hypothetical protein
MLKKGWWYVGIILMLSQDAALANRPGTCAVNDAGLCADGGGSCTIGGQTGRCRSVKSGCCCEVAPPPQKKGKNETAKAAKQRVRCVASCERQRVRGDGSRVCSNPPGFDTLTASCIAAGEARYVRRMEKAFGASQPFPSCGEYGGFTLASYTAAQLAILAAQIDPVAAPLIMCDDAQISCTSRVALNLAKYNRKLWNCLGKCYVAQLVFGDVTRQCTLQSSGDPFGSLDTTTLACVNTAVTLVTNSINRRCPTLPSCGLYPAGVQGLLDLVTAAAVNNAANSFCQ